jgi:hypothetical protein
MARLALIRYFKLKARFDRQWLRVPRSICKKFKWSMAPADNSLRHLTVVLSSFDLRCASYAGWLFDPSPIWLSAREIPRKAFGIYGRQRLNKEN